MSRWWQVLLIGLVPACVPPEGASTSTGSVPAKATAVYAAKVVSFTPGPGAGFGQDRLPAVVLGPPHGAGALVGSTDTLSLGVGGEVVLDLGVAIVNGPGPDLIVFENAFWQGGDPTRPFAELGEVSVSDDGSTWHTFPCDPAAGADGQWPGCAGWNIVQDYDAAAVVPLDVARSGGDVFDLGTLGLQRARFVRIRDRSTVGGGTSAGFDLDAVGGRYVAADGP